MITATLHRGLSGLAAVRERWQRLTSGLKHPEFFHLHGWQEASVRNLDPAPEALLVLELQRDDVSTGFVPLRPESVEILGVRLSVLALPRHTQAPLADLVLRDSERLAEYLEPVRARLAEARVPWDAIHLCALPAGSTAIEPTALRDSPLPSLGVWRTRFNVVPCEEPFEAISGRWSKNFRGNLRKARNKLQAAGTVRHVTTSDEGDFETCLSQFLEVEASGWKGGQGQGSAIALDPSRAEFYRSLGRGVGPEATCEVNLLLLDDLCIAGQFCLVCGDTVNVLKIGYREEHARLAPGNMLMEQLLRRGAESALVRKVSFVSDSEWHRDWRPESRDVFDVWIFNRTPRGRAAFAWMRSRRAAKRAYQRFVEPILHRG